MLSTLLSLLLCLILISHTHAIHRIKSDQQLDQHVDQHVDADAEARVKLQMLASSMDQEMFRSLMRTTVESEADIAMGAAYNEKRVGIEVELQTIPRMVVAVRPERIADIKTEFTTGAYQNIGVGQWLVGAVVPLRYGNTWMESKKDGNGVSYWKAMTDNERNNYKRDSIGQLFWVKVLVDWYVEGGDDRAEATAAVKRSLNGDCGRNAAMELVTLPLETSAAYATEPNYTYTMQVLRIFVAILRKFTYKVADGGLVTDAMIASNMPVEVQKVFAYAMGGDFKNLGTVVDGAWEGSAKTVVVTVTEVLDELEKELTKINKVDAWKDILNYDIIKRYGEQFLFSDPGNFKFSHQTKNFYDRYFVLPLQASPVEKSINLGFGPQLNFGFPVSKFAAPTADTMGKIQEFENYPDNGYWPMTERIWPYIKSYGKGLAEAAISSDSKQWKHAVKPTDIEKADARGFFVLLMHYYFIEGFLNLRSDKFAHSVLLKAPLNDVLRALPAKSRRIVASWWDSQKTVEAAFQKFDSASNSVWTKSKLADYGYTIPYATKGAPEKLAVVTEAKEFLVQVLESVTTNGVARWKNEVARVLTPGTRKNLLGKTIATLTVTTKTVYGEFNAAEEAYPAGRDSVSPVAKTVDPFYITKAGKQRPAVLLEHRDGGAISWKWGDIWNDPLGTPALMKAQLDARVNELVTIQTPLLLQMQERERAQALLQVQAQTGTPKPQAQAQAAKPATSATATQPAPPSSGTGAAGPSTSNEGNRVERRDPQYEKELKKINKKNSARKLPAKLARTSFDFVRSSATGAASGRREGVQARGRSVAVRTPIAADSVVDSEVASASAALLTDEDTAEADAVLAAFIDQRCSTLKAKMKRTPAEEAQFKDECSVV